MNRKIGHIIITAGLAVIAGVCAANISAQGPVNERPIHLTQRGPTQITGTIRWQKSYGVPPLDRRAMAPRPNRCGPFFVASLTAGSNSKLMTYTGSIDQNTMTEAPGEGDYYVCKYKLTVPRDTALYITPGMGGVLLLPKQDIDREYLTNPWFGGNYNRPPKGATRSFTGHRTITLTATKPSAVINFEMVYANDNPK